MIEQRLLRPQAELEQLRGRITELEDGLREWPERVRKTDAALAEAMSIDLDRLLSDEPTPEAEREGFSDAEISASTRDSGWVGDNPPPPFDSPAKSERWSERVWREKCDPPPTEKPEEDEWHYTEERVSPNCPICKKDLRSASPPVVTEEMVARFMGSFHRDTDENVPQHESIPRALRAALLPFEDSE